MDPGQRWQRTWERAGAAAPAGLIEELLAAYGEPHRAYHTLQHISECFAHLDASPLAPEEPVSLELALWFHDAVYDTKASDNEARSAAWARSALAALRRPVLDRVESLILVTRHEAEPATADEALLLDIDLSILGASPRRFDEYERQIRREYGWVPEPAYRAARRGILGQFQQRPALYHTDPFRELLESRARANLRRAFEALAEGGK